MKVSIISDKRSADLQTLVNDVLAHPPDGHFVQEIQFHGRSYEGGWSYVMIIWCEFPVTE